MITIRREKAEIIINYVRELLAIKLPHDKIEEKLQKEFGINPLAKCNAEAHENPMIDNCYACAPRWGFVGDFIKIK